MRCRPIGPTSICGGKVAEYTFDSFMIRLAEPRRADLIPGLYSESPVSLEEAGLFCVV